MIVKKERNNVKNIYKTFLLLICLFICSCANANIVDETEKNNSQERAQEVGNSDPEISKNLESGNQPVSFQPKEKASKIKTSSSNHYGILIEEQSLQIKKLRAELDFINEELYKLKAQSQVWENPFSIYNKEITLDNGSTIYGKIIYQDQNIIKAETLIGGLTIDRSTIVKVTENIVEIIPKDSLSAAPMQNFVKAGSIIEIEAALQNQEIERKAYKTKANLVVLGSIYEKSDENGNTILSGEIKNIGNTKKVFLLDFIDELEKQLGKKAIRNYMVMQKGDVKITVSNTSLLKKITKYNPTTHYKIGIKKFLEWYLFYYKIKK